MRNSFIILLVMISVFSFGESDRQIFDISLTDSGTGKVFTIAYSWDYSNPVSVEYDYLGKFFRRFNLEKGPGYFVEIREKNGNFWYAYKFDVNNKDIQLEKDLSRQKVFFHTTWEKEIRSSELNVVYNGNIIPMKKDGNSFHLELDMPVETNIDVYFKGKSGYIFGPVKYYAGNAHDRKIEVKLF